MKAIVLGTSAAGINTADTNTADSDLVSGSIAGSSSTAEIRFVSDYPVPCPTGGEALVRVLLCGICNTDLELLAGYMGFSGIPGHEFVGRIVPPPSPPVESLPPRPVSPIAQNHASKIHEDRLAQLSGKRVVGEINVPCGSCPTCGRGLPTHCENRSVLGILGRNGAMAEYLTLPMANLHVLPEHIPDEAAIFVEPLAAAFEILEQVRVSPADRVAVLGDGKLGLLCAMVLAQSGAGVTLFGRHERKAAIAEPYGVLSRTVPPEPGDQFDITIEATGSPMGMETAMSITRPRGTIVLKSTVAKGSALNLSPVVINELTVVGSRCGPFGAAIKALAEGTVDPRPMMEAVYPVEEAVKAFAHASAKGTLKVAISMREGRDISP